MKKNPCPLGGCPNKENIPQDHDRFLDHFSVLHTKKQGEIFLAVRAFEKENP